MQLFEMKNAKELVLGDEIKPIMFQNIKRPKGGNTKESDIEALIVSHPELLNCDEEQSEPELLIISRQLTTQTNKRADLVAIDRKGFLITIEVKRDAADEKNRSESMEFQSIRYAASHRTLSVDAIVRIFAQYLCALEKQKTGDVKYNDEFFLSEAKRKICAHLTDADDENEISVENIQDYIDPTDRQKIYLVASDFAEDCLSACAWLREHNIDIYCFKLQPYEIGDTLVLHQERLIPPTALDDFYIGTKEAKEKATKQQRSSCIKPTMLIWGEEEISCTSWSSLLLKILEKVLSNGFQVDALPLAHTENPEEAKNYYNQALLKWKVNNEERQIYIEKHANKGQILSWISSVLKGQPISASVTLVDGSSQSLCDGSK